VVRPGCQSESVGILLGAVTMPHYQVPAHSAREIDADNAYCALTLGLPAAPAPPLAFGPRQAEHLDMTPRAQTLKPTAGAVRASNAIQQNTAPGKSLPEIIDHETGVREILEILQSIVEQAGDLVESRSPELLAAARAALARYHDEVLAEAE
jgi:hypothetical protein